MTSARHRQPHAVLTGRRRLRLGLGAVAATLLTGSVVGVAIAAGDPTKHAASQAASRPEPMTVQVAPADRSPAPVPARTEPVSRSARRVTLQVKPQVRRREFLTEALNLWPAPREAGKPLAVLAQGGAVATTGVRRAGFAQILYRDQVRWVHADYLAVNKPGSSTGATTAGLSSAPCPDGSGTESGLTSSAVTLFRSVCHAFPALTTYGGYDAHGEHASGKAIDFMTSDSSLGQAIADWARAHASELDLYDIIWQQHIWTPVRASEGWRSMPDRGSPTANHYDHVHISVN